MRLISIILFLFFSIIFSGCSEDKNSFSTYPSEVTSPSSYTQNGTIKGKVTVPSAAPSRTVAAQSGGLGGVASLSVVLANVASSNQTPLTDTTGSVAVPTPLVDPVNIVIGNDGSFTASDLPSGTYALVYLDGSGQGQKVNTIVVKPGSTTIQNITNISANGAVTLTAVSELMGNALEGVSIRLNDLNETRLSDVNGSVIFDNLPAGDYSVTLSRDGFLSKYASFSVASGLTTNLHNIGLSTEKGSLSGNVKITDLENLANIFVYLQSSDGSLYTTLTNSSGNYHFSALPVAEGYSIIAYAHDFISSKVDNLEITSQQTTTAPTITLSQASTTGSLSGFARFSDINNSLQHAGIIVSVEGSDFEAITARDGSFILNNIPEGNYTVNFSDSNYNTTTKEVTLINGANTELLDMIIIAEVGNLTGRVVDDKGSAISNASITLTTLKQTLSTTTDSSGNFSINGVIAGTHTLNASKEGYGIDSTTVTIASSTTTDITSTPLLLQRLLLQGKVSLKDGGDLTTVSLTLYQDGASVASTQAKSNGYFSFAGIQAGSYTLQLTAVDHQSLTLNVDIPTNDGYVIAGTLELLPLVSIADAHYLSFDTIKGENTDDNNITSSLFLPSTLPFGSSVKWSSDTPSIISDSGIVTIPASTVTDYSVKLTATITYGTETQTKDFTFSVPQNYQPTISGGSLLTLPEDFGLFSKTTPASNVNGEPITFTLDTTNTNRALIDMITIDPTSGELLIRSKANAYGITTFDIIASSGDVNTVPLLQDTKSITLKITPEPDAVTAITGADQTITPSSVTLDGTNSIDIDGDAAYRWSIISAPPSSTATISNATSSVASFIPDRTGTYIFDLNLSNTQYSSSDQMTVNILPNLTVSGVGGFEGGNAIFTLRLSDNHSDTVNVHIATRSGSAKEYLDFQPVDKVVTFSANITDPKHREITVSVPLITDEMPEAAEQFYLDLLNTDNAVIQTASATAAINYQPLSLSNLTGTNGFTVEPAMPATYSGTSVSDLGDVNGDGFNDFAVTPEKNGDIFIIYGDAQLGRNGFISLDPNNYDPKNMLKIYNQSNLTVSLEAVGDINHDGFDDIGIGYQDDSSAYIIYGKADIKDRLGNSGVICLDDACAVGGDDLSGIALDMYVSGGNSGLGANIHGLGDINGDGIDDFAVAAPNINSNKGAVYVIFGWEKASPLSATDYIDLSTLDGSNGFIINGIYSSHRLDKVKNVGDINNDGIDDLYIAAEFYGTGYLIWGNSTLGSSGTFDLSTVASSRTGIEFSQHEQNLFFKAEKAGDINGDGKDDLLLYVNHSCALIFGRESLTTQGSIALTDIENSLDGDLGFEIDLGTIYTEIAAAGDFNGDGYNDIAFSDPTDNNAKGSVYVMYGGNHLGSDVSYVNAAYVSDGTHGFSVSGEYQSDALGDSLSAGRDLNGDGYDDLLIGAKQYNSDTKAHAYVIYGGNYNAKVTHQGYEYSESIDGTDDNDVIVAGNGDDVVNTLKGYDAVNGGSGDDTINVQNQNFFRVDGGLGKDTLAFTGSGKNIDLATLVSNQQINSIEAIDISGTGPNNITIDADASSKTADHASEGLEIIGEADDRIFFSDNSWQISDINASFTTYTNGIKTVKVDSRMPEYPSISVEDITLQEVEKGSATIRISRSNTSYLSKVTFEAIDGSAEEYIDFDTQTEKRLTFYIGQRYIDVSIPLREDLIFEKDISFTFSLYNPSNAYIKKSTATVTIQDNQLMPYGSGVVDQVRYNGTTTGERLGHAAQFIGDVDGDGFDDIAFSAPQYNGGQGIVYLLFGNADITLNDIDISNIASMEHLAIYGDASSKSHAGYVISRAGDVNGDGKADFIVTDGSNDTYIVYGNSNLRTKNYIDLPDFGPEGVKITESANIINYYRDHIVGGGDLNGDGFDDIVIGSAYADLKADGTSSLTNVGRVYVIYGRSNFPETFDITSDMATYGTIINGRQSWRFFGKTVDIIGDLNGDGFDDIVVGNSTNAYDDGYGTELFVIFGSALKSATIDITDSATFDGKLGFYFTGIKGLYDVSRGSDINGDGFDDLIFSHKQNDNTNIDGKVVVVYGGNTSGKVCYDLLIANGGTGTLDMLNFNSAAYGMDFYAYNKSRDEQFATSIEGGGDLNGDGYDDILVRSLNSHYGAGTLFVFWGKKSYTSSSSTNYHTLDAESMFYIDGYNDNDEFVTPLTLSDHNLDLGDFNGDGFADLLIGAPVADGESVDSGQVYMTLGNKFLALPNFYVGTQAGDTISFPNGGERYIVTGAGDDTVTLHNDDENIALGEGDDTLIIDYDTTINQGDNPIWDGGTGSNTLIYFSASSTLSTFDLTSMAVGRIENFNKIDMNGDGIDTQLNIDLPSTKRLLKRATGSNVRRLFIEGSSGDSVYISDVNGSNNFNGPYNSSSFPGYKYLSYGKYYLYINANMTITTD